MKVNIQSWSLTPPSLEAKNRELPFLLPFLNKPTGKAVLQSPSSDEVDKIDKKYFSQNKNFSLVKPAVILQTNPRSRYIGESSNFIQLHTEMKW